MTVFSMFKTGLMAWSYCCKVKLTNLHFPVDELCSVSSVEENKSFVKEARSEADFA